MTMISCSYIYIFLFTIIQITSIKGLTTSCQKNRYIDYNQMIETTCLIETCIRSSNCTDHAPCECRRDFVVRYNITIEHEDDDEDDHDGENKEDSAVHFAVIKQAPADEDQPIIIGEMYSCFYDERDVSTVFWAKPDRKTYFVFLSLSLALVFTIILVPIVYLILIIEFTNPEKKKDKK